MSRNNSICSSSRALMPKTEKGRRNQSRAVMPKNAPISSITGAPSPAKKVSMEPRNQIRAPIVLAHVSAGANLASKRQKRSQITRYEGLVSSLQPIRGLGWIGPVGIHSQAHDQVAWVI